MSFLNAFSGAAKITLTDEQQARRLCETLCDTNPDTPRLKTIAAVGAYDADIGGDRVDSRRLTAALAYLLQSGFLIDPDFEIDIVNFRERRDFLEEDAQADLVFISFIPATTHKGSLVYCRRSATIDLESWYDFRDFFGRSFSRHHSNDNWHGRIQRCDAKMIATYGGTAEISTHLLCGAGRLEPWVPLVNTPSVPMCQKKVKLHWGRPEDGGADIKTIVSLKALYGKAAQDLTMPWLGFAGRHDYLQQTRGSLNPESYMGRVALEYSAPKSRKSAYGPGERKL